MSQVVLPASVFSAKHLHYYLLMATCLVVVGLLGWFLLLPAPQPPSFHNDAELGAALLGKTDYEVQLLLGHPYAEGAANKGVGDNYLTWSYNHVYRDPETGKEVAILLRLEEGKVVKIAIVADPSRELVYQPN